MLENRRHLRIREVMDIQWSVQGQSIAGEGKILNLSSSGVLFQTDKLFTIPDKCIFELSTPSGPLSVKMGKVVWFKKIKPGGFYLVGIEFSKNAPNDQQLKEWIEAKISVIAQISDANIIKNYLS